jgi:hypothetical protein
MVPDGEYKVPSTRAADPHNRVAAVDVATQDILINFKDPKDNVEKVMRLPAARLAEGHGVHQKTPTIITTQLATAEGVRGFGVPAKKDPQEVAKEQAHAAKAKRTV